MYDVAKDGPFPWDAPDCFESDEPPPLDLDAPAPEPPRALRPREKLLSGGASRLSHTELLALVLGTGTRQESAGRVADRLLRRHGLKGLATLGAVRYRTERGIGLASAARLTAVFELGRRVYGKGDPDERPRVTSPREAFLLLRAIGRARKEHLVGLYLDAQSYVLHRETLSVGSLNTTRTHPREILYPAIAHLAHGFLIAHNHPSGSLEPSDEDVEFTRGVHRAGEMMGIELHDHLIITRNGFTSLRERAVIG